MNIYIHVIIYEYILIFKSIFRAFYFSHHKQLRGKNMDYRLFRFSSFLMNAPIWKEKERERVVVIWKMRIRVSTHAAGGESGLEKNGKCRFHNRFYGEREQKWTELSILYINSLNNQGHDGWKQTKQEYKFNCFSQFFKLSFNSVRANEICISGSMKDT